MHDLHSGSCPLCQHHEIIESRPRPIDHAHSSVPVEGTPPLALAHAVDERSPGSMKTRSPFGELQTLTCRRCGFTQWFALQPADVPIGPAYGTRLLVGNAAGAYR